MSDNAFHSSSGLIFKLAKNGESRLTHVLKHTKNDLTKPLHGVFDVGDDLVETLDESWAKIDKIKWSSTLEAGQSETIDGITRTIRKEASGKLSENFILDAGKKIGYEGGSKGSGNALTRIQVSVEKGTSEVLTAFPVK